MWSRLGVSGVHREMAAEGMSVNLEGDSRTTAAFGRWKESEANGGSKRNEGGACHVTVRKKGIG